MKRIYFIIILLMGLSVSADMSKNQNVQSWKIQEVTDDSDYFDLVYFPESIIVEYTDTNTGKLIIKLPSKDEPKIYSFSKSEPVSHEIVQNYKEGQSLKEFSEVTFFEDTIQVNLKWLILKAGQYKGEMTLGETISGSYEFVLEAEKLKFKRTNGEGDNLVVFKAIYSKDTP